MSSNEIFSEWFDAGVCAGCGAGGGWGLQRMRWMWEFRDGHKAIIDIWLLWQSLYQDPICGSSVLGKQNTTVLHRTIILLPARAEYSLNLFHGSLFYIEQHIAECIVSKASKLWS